MSQVATNTRQARPGVAPTRPLVCVEQVCKAYRNGALETHVLRDASFELSAGESTSLMGVSGSGKSTLIALIAGLLIPDSGRVVFDGEDITGLEDRDRAALRARRIGVALQSGNLIGFLTARENVELAIGFGGGGRVTARADELLGELGLGDRRDHLPRRLSGGETQRVSLAMALANEPDLLLADEVVGELDAATAAQVMDVIFGACEQRGLSVLLVTHSRELAQHTQRRLRLTDGRVVSA